MYWIEKENFALTESQTSIRSLAYTAIRATLIKVIINYDANYKLQSNPLKLPYSKPSVDILNKTEQKKNCYFFERNNRQWKDW